MEATPALSLTSTAATPVSEAPGTPDAPAVDLPPPPATTTTTASSPPPTDADEPVKVSPTTANDDPRVVRLNKLLEQSNVYSRLLKEKMDRQQETERLKREAALKAVSKEAAVEETAASSSVATGSGEAAGAEEESSSETAQAGEKRKAEEDIIAKEESEGSKDGAKRPKTGEYATDEPAPHGAQPRLITGAKLRDYQLAGVEWMASLYSNGLNGILADEMGLGKTIQTISFLAHLKDKGVWGPFMIACPLSVLYNWKSEFEKFAPSIPTVMYHGTPLERQELRRTRLGTPVDATGNRFGGALGNGKRVKPVGKRARREVLNTPNPVENTMATFPIVITTYEIVMQDSTFLRGFQWKYIIVDEGHRLKNMDCKLIRELKTYTSANRLILTGTPLHNNLSELWSLLNFILPDIFDDLDSFQAWFDLDTSAPGATLLSGDQTTGIVSKLHSILKPFLLRRLKVDVEKDLPPKKEYRLSAPITVQQKELYESVVSRSIRNFLYNKQIAAGEDSASFIKDDDELAERENDTNAPSSSRSNSTPPPSESKGPEFATMETVVEAPKIKRKIGRPRKFPVEALPQDATPKVKRGSGRPRKDLQPKADEAEVVKEEVDEEEAATSSSAAATPMSTRKSRTCAVRQSYAIEDDDDTYFEQLSGDMVSPASKQATNKTAYDIGRQFHEKAARKSVNNMKLQNVVMQLRKVANHPWLFHWPLDETTGQQMINMDLVNASGKMLLLNRLLDELFARKHKVLLFSQFTSMLDIIEDWAIEYKKLKICRIDGSTPQDLRRSQMEEFNKGDEGPDACRLFLLSTRAGGLGINLVSADTVIFYDQDWNPQMDLQAMDRAHRIGQTRPVLVFRLVTAHTIEDSISARAGAKRRLEALVMADGHGKFKGDGKERKSTIDEAALLLKLEGDKINLVNEGDKIISDADLDALLDRSPEAFARSTEWHLKGEDQAKEKGKATMFSVFEAARDDVNDGLARMDADQ